MTTPDTTEEFTGEIGRSMAEFSSEYMTHIEAHLDEPTRHRRDRYCICHCRQLNLVVDRVHAGHTPSPPMTVSRSPATRSTSSTDVMTAV